MMGCFDWNLRGFFSLRCLTKNIPVIYYWVLSMFILFCVNFIILPIRYLYDKIPASDIVSEDEETMDLNHS
jgi:hypothetical protein